MPDNVKRLPRFLPFCAEGEIDMRHQKYMGLGRGLYVESPDVAPLEERLAETEAENGRLHDGIAKDRHAYLMAGWRYEKLMQAESQNARMAALLREESAMQPGCSCVMETVKLCWACQARALLAEIDGGGA